jgi:hypothetical protein
MVKTEVEVNVDFEEPQVGQSPGGMLSEYAWLVHIDF